MAAHSSKVDFYDNGIERMISSTPIECDICREITDNAPSSSTVTATNDSAANASTGAILNGLLYNVHNAIKITACGHIFGNSCLWRWLADKTTCPMCRLDLFPIPTFEESMREVARYNENTARFANNFITARQQLSSDEFATLFRQVTARLIWETQGRDNEHNEGQGMELEDVDEAGDSGEELDDESSEQNESRTDEDEN